MSGIALALQIFAWAQQLIGAGLDASPILEYGKALLQKLHDEGRKDLTDAEWTEALDKRHAIEAQIQAAAAAR